MHTVTLWESGLRTYSLPSTWPNSPAKKSFNSSCCKIFRLSKRNSNYFQWKFSRLRSRLSSRWHSQIDEEQFGNFGYTAWDNTHGLESRLLYCESNRVTEGSLDDCDVFCVSPSNHRLENENRMATEVPVSHISLHRLLMSVLLFGSLTLQSTQPAVAASDFATRLQSVNFFGDLGDITTGFASAFLLIFFSELGDKTFFIAALLAARNSAAVVFTGTFSALSIMTIISVVLGRTFHYIDGVLPFKFGEIDLPIDDIAAVCLLVYFGVSTLIDTSSSDGLKADQEQKEAELAVSEFSGNGAGILAVANTIISTFLLVFVAEWGDKSFFSTVALAAASSPLGVIGGALAGHGLATLIAVLGGSLLGAFLSEKVVSYTGGVLFLVFAGITLIEIIKG
ncbi:hypothetical protein Nepgr_030693 [Nepenthes gracilis]|uniref:GDT1 family protein n=1 Tax=Nepenthes gracilis TaxID=150966 RepID=A0AAD3TF24_NEPGR|nr:hypothetical protein Nepgr_030693 [Nepenthes gracilis]